ncbi:unknown [Acidaminococcus intestini CAG:325]|nr:unknown [Acidaminococcus intestini CAG:325]
MEFGTSPFLTDARSRHHCQESRLLRWKCGADFRLSRRKHNWKGRFAALDSPFQKQWLGHPNQTQWQHFRFWQRNYSQRQYCPYHRRERYLQRPLHIVRLKGRPAQWLCCYCRRLHWRQWRWRIVWCLFRLFQKNYWLCNQWTHYSHFADYPGFVPF